MAAVTREDIAIAEAGNWAKSEVAQAIKHTMEQQNMTWEDLSDKLSVSPVFLQKVFSPKEGEESEYPVINVGLVGRVFCALGYTLYIWAQKEEDNAKV